MALNGVSKNCRRERTRLNYLAVAKIQTEIGMAVFGNLRDIAIESLYVKIDEPGKVILHHNDTVDVDIMVTKGLSRLTIAVPGVISRVDDDGVVVMFTEPLKWWPIFSLFPVNEQFLFDIVA